MISQIAKELNEAIAKSSPSFLEALSELGKKMYFPKGIISQGAEASQHAHLYNATLGIAWAEGSPMALEPTLKYFNNLKNNEILPYAPTEGRKKLREVWKKQLVEKNPSLAGKSFSLPVVTNGITHSISLSADLFCDKGDNILFPDLFWGNYRLMFDTIKDGQVSTFKLFDEKLTGFNIQSFSEAVDKLTANKDKLLILLNFPNNPSGYTPTVKEFQQIKEILVKKAEKGKKIVALIDDAYFGLNYEDGSAESIFSMLCDAHENVIAVKLDGSTKENYVWGFRCSFITFGVKAQNSKAMYAAIEKKVGGLIRARISSSNHAAQTIMEKSLEDAEYQSSYQKNFDILEKRASKTKQILKAPKFAKHFAAYPFNSGYFMCIKLHKINAEELRTHLLVKKGIGTISINADSLRIAFCSVDEKNLTDFFERLYDACEELS